MSDMDDLDELERELGPSVRLALHHAAADITEERQPKAASVTGNGPAAPGAWFDAARDRDPLEAGGGGAMVVDLEPAPNKRARRRRSLVAAAAVALVLLVGSVLVWAASRHDAGTQLPAGPDHTPTTVAPTPTSLRAPEVPGPDPASTLLTSWTEFPVGSSFVYANGRVIWGPVGDDRAPGVLWFLERHLNSAGLDLVWSGDLKAEDVVRGNVPPDLWADPQNAGYTASEYAACLWQQTTDYSHPFRDATNRLRDLPAPAQALLHTRRMFLPADDVQPWSACFAVSPEEAVAVLDLAGPRFQGSLTPRPLSGAFGAAGPWVVLIPASTGEGAIGVTLFPILPHGEPLLWSS